MIEKNYIGEIRFRAPIKMVNKFNKYFNKRKTKKSIREKIEIIKNSSGIKDVNNYCVFSITKTPILGSITSWQSSEHKYEIDKTEEKKGYLYKTIKVYKIKEKITPEEKRRTRLWKEKKTKELDDIKNLEEALKKEINLESGDNEVLGQDVVYYSKDYMKGVFAGTFIYATTNKEEFKKEAEKYCMGRGGLFTRDYTETKGDIKKIKVSKKMYEKIRKTNGKKLFDKKGNIKENIVRTAHLMPELWDKLIPKEQRKDLKYLSKKEAENFLKRQKYPN